MARGFDIEAVNLAQANTGADVGPRGKFNFIEGPGGLTIAVTDNPGNDSIDVIFDNSQAGVLGAVDAGGAVGPQGTVRLIAGANVTITLFEDVPGGELEFTITAPGGFPGFDGATPLEDSDPGSAGFSATAARGDHSHPESTAYTDRDGIEACIGAFDTAGTMTLSYAGSPTTFSTSSNFRPRFVIAMYKDPGGDESSGFAIGTGAAQQMTLNQDGAGLFTGVIASNTSGSRQWTMTTFASTQSIFTHTAGASVHRANIAVIGDNLP